MDVLEHFFLPENTQLMGKYILGIFLTFVTGKHKGDMLTD